jgi:pyruvate/2-oxoglutarate dehydrogenase complex dihydrolipoamide acyltransferase (E2) component
MPAERIESLDYAERWFNDGVRVAPLPTGCLGVEVEMSRANALRAAMRDSGTRITYAHLLTKAAASALTRNPHLHQMVSGNRRLRPAAVDICLSVSTPSPVTPVLIVKDAGRKNLETIVDEITGGIGRVRAEDEKFRAFLRRWGGLVPFSFVRRLWIGTLLRRLSFRRMLSGTFQVTVVPTADFFVPILFNTTAVLGGGSVRDRVIAIGGKPEVRPVMTLICLFDHKVWNGLDAATFLNAVKEELEQAGTEASSLRADKVPVDSIPARL